MPFNIDVNYKQNSVVDLTMNNPITNNPVEPVTAVIRTEMGSFVQSSLGGASTSVSNNGKTITVTGSAVDVNNLLNTLFLQAETETHYFKILSGTLEINDTIHHGFTGETAQIVEIVDDRYYTMPYIPLSNAYPIYNSFVTGRQFYSQPISCDILSSINNNEVSFTVLENTSSTLTFIAAGASGTPTDIYDVVFFTGLCGCDNLPIYESISGGGTPFNTSLTQTLIDLLTLINSLDNGYNAAIESPYTDLIINSPLSGAESYNGISLSFITVDTNNNITNNDSQIFADGSEGNIHEGEGWAFFNPDTASGIFLKNEQITINVPTVGSFVGYKAKYVDTLNNQLTFYPTPMEINDAVLPSGTIITGDVSGATGTVISSKTAAPIGNYTVNVEIFQFNDSNIFDQGTINLKGYDPTTNSDGRWNILPEFTVTPPDTIIDWSQPFNLGQVIDADTASIQVEALIKRHPQDTGYNPPIPNGPDYIQNHTYGNFDTKRIANTSTVVGSSGAVRWKFFGSIEQCNEALNNIIYCPIDNESSYFIELRVYDGFTRISNTPGAQ